MSDWKNWGGPLDEVGEEWFVNRSFELEWLWKWASEVPKSFRSQSLVGLRRTGKTAILHKIFNRLYHEQTKVTPIYISFGDYVRHTKKEVDAYAFATEFFEGYWRSFLSFKYQRPELHRTTVDLEDLRSFAKDESDEIAIPWIERFDRKIASKWADGRSMAKMVIAMPNAIAKQHNKPSVLMIDEFQALTNVVDPDTNRYYDITNFFQKASESRRAPMIVSGSSISMMVDEALVGALAGRFKSTHLEPLTQDYATDMMFRLAAFYEIELTERQALEIWETTRGYPYSIECLLRDPNFPKANGAEDRTEDNPEDDSPKDPLEDFLVEVLTSRTSELREHYHEEFGKYISRLNEVTREVLLWIIKNPEKRIRPFHIVEDLGLDKDLVRECLDQLYKGDVINSNGSFGFEDPADPLLRQYIHHQHRYEVDNLAPEVALQDLRTEINSIQGKANHRVGHLAEVIVGGVMERFDKREVDGNAYFGLDQQVRLPKMAQIDRREGVIKKGAYNEIDVIGEYAMRNNTKGAWLVSVRYRDKKMGVSEVEKFIQHAAATQQEKQYGQVTRWYFSKCGFTQDAEQLLRDEAIYHSNVDEFNELANLFGFLGLRF